MSGKQSKKMRGAVKAEIEKVISSLKVNNGDVILVRNQSLVHRNMNKIAEVLGDAGLDKCIMIAVNEFDDLTIVDEEGMKAHGWQRIETESNE